MIPNASRLYTTVNIDRKLDNTGSLTKTISCCCQDRGLRYQGVDCIIYLELECEHEDSIQLDQERVHWQTLVNMTMNLQVPQTEISLPPENVSSSQAAL